MRRTSDNMRRTSDNMRRPNDNTLRVGPGDNLRVGAGAADNLRGQSDPRGNRTMNFNRG